MIFTLVASAAALSGQVAVKNAFAAGVTTLSNCGKSTDILTRLDEVVLTPYPVVAGQPLVVSIRGATSANITQGASVHVVGKLAFIPVLTKDIDVCSQPGVTCPIAAGDNEIQVTQSIPAIAPAGNLNIEIGVKNGDGAQVACLKGPIKIVKA
ncbi:MD-2-related lipid-recognition domain-containing protein [Gorgonomyces haynaldii]|nr:MD-2-related lipid-recognition domain-containing protein [Gorgonomyces haynaldii]